MTARTFIWLATGGGAWALAANWDDVTDGVNPSAIAPGPQDSVTVAGPSGTAVESITGSGAVAAGLFTGNTLLSGTYTIGTLAVGTPATGGLLQLAAGTTLQSTSASLVAGSLLVNGTGAGLNVAGQLTLGDGLADGLSTSLDVTSGGTVAVLGLLMNAAACQIYVDPASIFEVGTLGTGAAGFLTIDPGQTLSGQGDANAYGAVVNNGTIQASAGGTLAIGAVSGIGGLLIGAGATLELNGAAGAGENLRFTGANGTLDLQAEHDAPSGTLYSFAAGDAIDVSGSLISSAAFTQSSSGGGELTLYYGAQVAAQIALAGNFTQNTFLTTGDGAGGTLIELSTATGGGGIPSPGTSTPDAYLWGGKRSGAWGTATNWQDLTSGANPAAIAPGVNDSVTINAAAASFTSISGPANAASLAITGEVALSGVYNIGTLDIGQGSGSAFTPGTLDLLPATSIAAAAGTIAAGAISVSGSAAVLTVGGTMVLGGGNSGVGLPVTALTATSGGAVRAAALAIGGGSGNSITTDPTGSVEIGTLGGAAAGAITIDRGATLTGNGSINPLGAIVDNGSIVATGGVLAMGTITGSGSITIGTGALDLNYATALSITFANASGTLALAGTAASPTGTITNIVQGDVIDVLGDPISNVQFNRNANSTGGTVVLIYNGYQVGSLIVAGTFGGIDFITIPDGAGGSLVELSPLGGGGGGSGQTGTDQLLWTGTWGPYWSNSGCWMDVTAGIVATLPPGPETPAVVNGGTGNLFISIGGTGVCASLLQTGNVYYTGVFNFGALSIGQDAAGTAPASTGTLLTYPGAAITISSGFMASGELELVYSTLSGGTGSFTLGDGGGAPILDVQSYSKAQLGGLVLGGGSVIVDEYSSVEIGALGSASLNALTVDPGTSASGFGTLNPLGAVVDNGTITARGGTLEVGALSGVGQLAIGTEAALSLLGAAPLPIEFFGAGATLVFANTDAAPTGVIAGFAPGDSIVVSGSPVGGVFYAPGPAGIGTLTLTESGQVAATLAIAGNFAGDVFAVQPDGIGAAITVTPPNGVGNGPPPGTVTPDQYTWTGAVGGAGGVLWANAGNWIDTSQSQNPAAVAPGQNDLVTIAAAAGKVQSITGPADAAAVTLLGTVSLGGTFGIGTLAIGTAQGTGMLALGANANIQAARVQVLGGIAGTGGTLAVGGQLGLGLSGIAAGLLDATGATAIIAGSVALHGTGSLIETDATGSIDIGGLADAAPGSITIDPGGVLTGTGAANPAGQIVDNGTLQANAGTLVAGSVSGSGTLLVGLNAGLMLNGTAADGLTVGFAGAGTLSILGSQAGFAAAIAGFGPSDEILLPEGSVTQAVYALQAPGVGVVTLLSGTEVVGELTFLGSYAGEIFDVAGSPGGGTILTTVSANMAGQGGITMSNGSFPFDITGSYSITPDAFYGIAPSAYSYLYDLLNGPPFDNGAIDAWYMAGDTATVGAPYPGLNVEVLGPLSGYAPPGGIGPGSNLVLQSGYNALIAMGTEQINLFDNGVGNSLLVGNANSDPLVPTTLVDTAANDTLVGGQGGNTVFVAQGGNNVNIAGGGNDTIVTEGGSGAGADNASVTTSGGHSNVFLGASDNNVVSKGADQIICGGYGVAQDIVSSEAPAGTQGPTVFGPRQGEVTFSGGADAATVVGSGGQVAMTGGAANGNELWAGTSYAQYEGGAGSGIVVGGSGGLLVQGGGAPTTVFGGTGPTVIENTSGNSIDVVGAGPTTINAGAGNAVWIYGSAQVSISGAAGLNVYGGSATGNNIFNAGAGSETLWGGAGNDQFLAGSGNGTFVSAGGSDVFNFTNGLAGGTDEIVGFVPGADTIALHGYGSSLPSMTVQSGSTFFTLADGTHVILYGVTNMGAGSFTTT